MYQIGICDDEKGTCAKLENMLYEYSEKQGVKIALYIQTKIKEGVYSLVWSYILDYENGRNPYEEKRRVIALWKRLASECIAEESEEILTFAESLSEKGIKTYDALHIACAVSANCEFYLTTDKKLLNTPIPEIKIVNPIIFVNEMEG